MAWPTGLLVSFMRGDQVRSRTEEPGERRTFRNLPANMHVFHAETLGSGIEANS